MIIQWLTLRCVISWRHQIETFSALLALCEGNPPITGGFPSQRPVTRNFDVFIAWTLYWASNRNARDLKRHRAHYDATVMVKKYHCTSYDAIYRDGFGALLSWNVTLVDPDGNISFGIYSWQIWLQMSPVLLRCNICQCRQRAEITFAECWRIWPA